MCPNHFEEPEYLHFYFTIGGAARRLPASILLSMAFASRTMLREEFLGYAADEFLEFDEFQEGVLDRLVQVIQVGLLGVDKEFTESLDERLALVGTEGC